MAISTREASVASREEKVVSLEAEVERASNAALEIRSQAMHSLDAASRREREVSKARKLQTSSTTPLPHTLPHLSLLWHRWPSGRSILQSSGISASYWSLR